MADVIHPSEIIGPGEPIPESGPAQPGINAERPAPLLVGLSKKLGDVISNSSVGDFARLGDLGAAAVTAAKIAALAGAGYIGYKISQKPERIAAAISRAKQSAPFMLGAGLSGFLNTLLPPQIRGMTSLVPIGLAAVGAYKLTATPLQERYIANVKRAFAPGYKPPFGSLEAEWATGLVLRTKAQGNEGICALYNMSPKPKLFYQRFFGFQNNQLIGLSRATGLFRLNPGNNATFTGNMPSGVPCRFMFFEPIEGIRPFLVSEIIYSKEETA